MGTGLVGAPACGDVMKLQIKVKEDGKTIEKGSAFPTCISVNNCVGHYSPLVGEEPHLTLAEGDVIKIDLGVHIDGYIAVVAHTLQCAAEPLAEGNELTGRAADVVECCYKAAELAQRMFKEGAKNTAISLSLIHI